MRSHVKHIIAGVFLLLGGITANASAPYNLADSGNAAYAKGNYAKAINMYSMFIDRGYESANVYYNLGNCYYRTNDVAKAILYYEKAKKLSPGDADILFNLQIANQKTIDKIAPESQLFFVNWWNNFVNTASEKGWAIICIVLFSVCLVLIIFYLLSPSVIVKKMSFWCAGFILALSLFSFILARQQYRTATAHDTAIVMSPTVTVKGSPTENATQLFVVHEGAKVHIIKINDNWIEIKLSNGNQGWVQASDIAMI